MESVEELREGMRGIGEATVGECVGGEEVGKFVVDDGSGRRGDGEEGETKDEWRDGESEERESFAAGEGGSGALNGSEELVGEERVEAKDDGSDEGGELEEDVGSEEEGEVRRHQWEVYKG